MIAARETPFTGGSNLYLLRKREKISKEKSLLVFGMRARTATTGTNGDGGTSFGPSAGAETTSAARQERDKNVFDCLRAIEKTFPNEERFTIGDLHAIIPEFPGGVLGLRRTVFIAAAKVDALVETTTRRGDGGGTASSSLLEGEELEVEKDVSKYEVVFSFPRNCRSICMARDAAFRASLLRRRTFRAFYTFLRVSFSIMLIVSVIVVALALVAMLILVLANGRSDNRGGGGGEIPLFMNPGYGPGPGGGGGNMDGFWMYLYMRDIMWLSYWDDLERRRVYLNGDIYNNANVVTGVPVKPSSGGRGAGGGGGDDNDDDNSNSYHNNNNSGNFPDPEIYRRLMIAEEDDHDHETIDKTKELSFIESIYAFVFGRGDPNEFLEHERSKAISQLLRANRGVVFAEQLAAFTDAFLLEKKDRKGMRGGSLFFSFFKSGSRRDVKKDDASRSLDEREERQHEGYVLRILEQFYGHAESDDYGRLIYIFPSFQVTAEENKTDAQIAKFAPPPIPPPIYEKQKPVFEYGVKGPLVVFTGIFNVFLLFLFYRVGGLDFKAPRRTVTRAQLRRSMGRRGGQFSEAQNKLLTAGPDDEEIIIEQPPALVAFFEIFPKLAQWLYKPMVYYAIFFFVVPLIRAFFIQRENKAIARRNAIRKVRAKEALLMCVKACEEKRDLAERKQKRASVFNENGSVSNV